MQNKLAEDLNNILDRGGKLWPDLKDARFFITGGTGFIGTWLLESFVWLNDRLDLNMSALILTRDADAFGKKAPHLTHHPSIAITR